MSRPVRRVALVLAVGVAAAACGDSRSAAPTPASALTVFGPYVGVEADRFAEVLRDFEVETGIEVAYTGSIDFARTVRQRTVGEQRPDVAIVPQPGLVEELIDDGVASPLGDEPLAAVRDAFAPDVLERMPWNLDYVVPYRSNTKSLVWYRPSVFADNGWSVPATLDELSQLVRVVAEGDAMAPWCFSVFAGSATGWPATDWIEDLVLRRSGPELYERWAAGEVSWQATTIRDAFEEFDRLVLDGGRSAGGRRAVLQTEIPDAAAPLFGDEPGCAMFKQASFAEDWFPAGTAIGPGGDVDFFVLPDVEPDRRSLVTGGDAVVILRNRPSAQALMTHLASADGARAWADVGGFVSERTDVAIDDYYGEDADAIIAELLRSDAVARFDASDQLPPDIGSGLLWSQITQWIAGTITLDELLDSIDESLGLGEEEP